MRRAAQHVVILVVIAILGCSRNIEPQQAAAQPPPPAEAASVRATCVAGQFYKADPEKLAKEVNGYLAAAQVPEIADDIIAVVAPHAGYEFSGPVAGYSYAILKDRSYDTVILVGPSHRGMPLSGAALSSHRFWETPLGKVPVNGEMNEKLLATSSRFKMSDAAHDDEHCLETQLPFLQTVLEEFSIVPIVFSDFAPHNTRPIGEAIASVANEKTLLVISTDLSHYPAAKQANLVDHGILDAICTLDVDTVYAADRELLARDIPNLHCTACGLGPVVAGIGAAKMLGATRANMLYYANSADADPRSASRCVGYGAVAFVGERKAATFSGEPGDTSSVELDSTQQQYLLKLARSTIEAYLDTGTLPDIATSDPAMHQQRAVFVTLTKDGKLRGCIGQIIARHTLAAAVREAAVSAAVRDHRFPPVTRDELDELHIEISVLSPMEPVASYTDIEVGKHGVMVVRGRRSGVFLPQVAPEQGWGRDQMLQNLCSHKAGLPADAYKDPDTELYAFTAQVFGESEEH